MSLIDRLLGREPRAFDRYLATLADEPARAPQAMTNGSLSMQELSDWIIGQRTNNEVTSVRSALTISAVYACVSLIAGAVASMPLKFYQRNSETGERKSYTPDYWWMFNESWMPCWPAATAWEFALTSKLLRGDFFARIHRASPFSPKIVGFEPWHPDCVQVERRDDRLRYTFAPQTNLQPHGAKPIVLDQDDVLHVAGPGFDGLRGMSQISTVLHNTGAISLAADEYSASFFRNSARPDYALSTDKTLSVEQLQAMRDQIAERHQGAQRAFRPMVLLGGLKVEPITMTTSDAQLIETRGFQVEDIARIFGVPPFMVGHAEKTTSWGSGVEQMGLSFVKYTLQRHLVAIEQEINRKVFRTAGNFCEFLTDGLERGDVKTRNEAYRVAIGRAGEPGWMTINEVRKRENLPPVPEGEKLHDPAATANTAAAAARASDEKLHAELSATREQIVGAIAGQQPPVVNVDVAAPVVNVKPSEVLVEAPVVNVQQPAVTVEAPIVNVPEQPAPVVNVSQPEIHVAAPQVVIARPKREIEDIERDDNGEMTRITRTTED